MIRLFTINSNLRVEKRDRMMLKFFLNLVFFSLTVQLLPGPGCSCLNNKNQNIEPQVNTNHQEKSIVGLVHPPTPLPESFNSVVVAYNNLSPKISPSPGKQPVVPQNSPALPLPKKSLPTALDMSCISPLPSIKSKTPIEDVESLVTPTSLVPSHLDNDSLQSSPPQLFRSLNVSANVSADLNTYFVDPEHLNLDDSLKS